METSRHEKELLSLALLFAMGTSETPCLHLPFPSPPKPLLPLAQRSLLRAVPVSSISCRGHSAPAARQRVALGGQEGDSPSEKPRQQERGHAEATRSDDMQTEEGAGLHCPATPPISRRKSGGGRCWGPSTMGEGGVGGQHPHHSHCCASLPSTGACASLSSVTRSRCCEHAGEGAVPCLTASVSWPRTRRIRPGREAAC